MSILAMLRLATTTAMALVVDIIGCNVPTRVDGDSASQNSQSPNFEYFCKFFLYSYISFFVILNVISVANSASEFL